MNLHRSHAIQTLIISAPLLLTLYATVAAQDTATTFERLTLLDGTTYEGFLRSQGKDEIEFVEIFRRPGMPMSATVRIVDPGQVKQHVPVNAQRREALAAQVHRMRHRVAIESGDVQRISLAAAPSKRAHSWEYSGTWFDLTSTADDESTRRCIVRIEQIFRAYRQLLPAIDSPRRRLRIVLYGSIDEYQTELRKFGIEIENLAFYASRDNLIFAGAELTSYSKRLHRIREAHDDTMQQLDLDEKRFRAELKRFSERLSDQGLGREEIKEEMARRNAAWKRERLLVERQISETNRRNNAAFSEVTNQMFRRLYHEAFHAYLANDFVGERATQIDRWLNEGLAQIFEVGQLDGDTLRVDAPNQASLAKLQTDLASNTPLSLAELLVSQERDFLASHQQTKTARHYAYAWGLAYYLMVEKQLISPGSLAGFLTNSRQNDVERFESLVDAPLSEFEREWRAAMMQLPSK